MARIIVKQPLRRYTGNLGEHQVEGSTVGGVLRVLGDLHPGITDKLFRDDGSLRTYVVIYLDGRDIRLLDGADTPVGPGSEIKLFAALAGG
jgi:molybdopterin converting factor small subunit